MSRVKLCLVSVLSKIKNLSKISLRSFENVVPGDLILLMKESNGNGGHFSYSTVNLQQLMFCIWF